MHGAVYGCQAFLVESGREDRSTGIRFTTHLSVDTILLRREIAARLIEFERYAV
jgi:hypothetical protein